MAEPSLKSDPIEELISSFYNKSRRDTIEGDMCISCNQEAIEFEDALSRKEYSISGLCQLCQNSVFGGEDCDA